MIGVSLFYDSMEHFQYEVLTLIKQTKLSKSRLVVVTQPPYPDSKVTGSIGDKNRLVLTVQQTIACVLILIPAIVYLIYVNKYILKLITL